MYVLMSKNTFGKHKFIWKYFIKMLQFSYELNVTW